MKIFIVKVLLNINSFGKRARILTLWNTAKAGILMRMFLNRSGRYG